MKSSFKKKENHLNKINNISNDILIKNRFLRNNSMEVINPNNEFELIKKCYSNLISPSFKENYYDILTSVLAENKVKLISSYCKDSFKKKITFDYNFMNNLNKNDSKLNNKKLIILSLINKQKNLIKKEKINKSKSTKDIFHNKEISFAFNNNSFLNRFENLKNKCNSINKNNLNNSSSNNLLKSKNIDTNKKKNINFKDSSYAKDYSPFFKDSFFNDGYDLKSKIISDNKVNDGVLKFKKKLNLYKL